MYKKIATLLLLLPMIISADSIILPSARKCRRDNIEEKKIGYITNVDFIVEKLKVDDLAFVVDNNKITELDYKWRPGFKVGFGIYIPKSTWDIYLNYRYLHSKPKKSKEGTLSPIFWRSDIFQNQSSSVLFSNSNASLKINFHTLDLEIGDSFYISKNIALQIYGGLRSLMIKQKMYVLYEDGNNITNSQGESIKLNSGTTKIKTNTKGIGPRFGINSEWKVQKHINLLADGAVSFILSRIVVRYHEYDLGYNLTTSNNLLDEYKMHEYVWVIRPNATISSGLSFFKCFSKNYLEIGVKYSIDYFFEQNLTRRVINRNLTYPNKGDLFLHGLEFSCYVEF